MKERLQKIMARANLGSRRACEELIEQKRVRVNGVVAQLGDKADPAVDVIEVDGRKLTFTEQRKVYVALNKPVNVLTTNLGNHKDKRQTVRELIAMEGHLFSIGRLDAESEGLIVMTNDGELVQRLTHPKYRHTKTYKVSVYGLPSLETLERWRIGIFLQDEDGTTYKTAPCSVEILKGDREITTLRIVMTEGRKRQIRRVAASLGHPVQRLIRTHIGKLEIGSLRPGEWRELTSKEVNELSIPADELKFIKERKREINRLRRDDYEEGDRQARPFRPQAGGRGKPMIGGSKSRRPREDEGDERPRRPRREGDSERSDDRPRRARPQGAADSDRPRRPRAEGERPPRPYSEGDDRPRRRRPEGDSERSDERPRRPHPQGAADSDRPRRPRAEGDRPPRPFSEGDERPRRPRREGDSERSDDRPRRPRPQGAADTDRPRRPRREGDRPPRPYNDEGNERPRRPRSSDESSERSDDRPRRPRPQGTSDAPRTGSDRPRRPRPTDSSEGSEDKPRRPRSNRPAGGGQSKPRRPRSGDDKRGGRPSGSGGNKPRTPRPKKPRSG